MMDDKRRFISLSQSYSRVHAFLFEDGEGLTLVDSLADPEATLILNAIKSLGYRPTDLKRIILTHGHPSHVRGAATLKRLSGALVYAPIEEQDIIEGKRPSNRTTLIPQPPFRILPLQYLLNLQSILWNIGIRPSRLNVVPVEVDCPIRGDDEQIGPVTTFSTPGHSPGSTSFYWPDKKTLFIGDVIVTWPKFEAGWRGITENNPRNLDSIRRLVNTFEGRNWPVHRIASGHGDPVESEDGLGLMKSLLKNP